MKGKIYNACNILKKWAGVATVLALAGMDVLSKLED